MRPCNFMYISVCMNRYCYQYKNIYYFICTLKGKSGFQTDLFPVRIINTEPKCLVNPYPTKVTAVADPAKN